MKDTICARTEVETKETIRREGELRGHSLSEAVDYVLKFGIPEYLKKVPVKFTLAKDEEKQVA